MDQIIIKLFVDLTCSAIASAYLITAWQHGSIFSSCIAALENNALVDKTRTAFDNNSKLVAFASKLQDLLLCPLCLSPYVCLILIIGLQITVYFYFVVAVFAAAQISYLLCRINAD